MNWALRIIAVSGVCFAVHATSAAEPVREIPDRGWVPIFFETIDRVAERAQISALRTATLPADHLEARFWFGFGLGGTNALVVRRDKAGWNASWITEDAHRKDLKTRAVTPKNPWEDAWRLLCDKKLLTLPDFESLPSDGIMVHDGSCCVVETYAEGKYRTYMYANSWAHDHLEARDLEALVAAASFEFLGGDGKAKARRFLSELEVLSVADVAFRVKYPLTIAELLRTLPVNLVERDLQSHGSSGIGDVFYKEWQLTSRVDPRGYYSLVAILAAKGLSDRSGQDIAKHAEVVFTDRAMMERKMVLQPQDYPVKRSPEAKP